MVTDLGVEDVDQLSSSVDGRGLAVLTNDKFKFSAVQSPLDFRTVDVRVSVHSVQKIDSDEAGFTVYYRYGGIKRVWIAGPTV